MNTDQAFDLLKQAGVTNSIQTVRRWLREGKIKATRSENRKAGFLIDEADLKRFINERTGLDKDERIRELEKEIKKMEAKIKQKERGKLSQENHKMQLELDKLRSENLSLKMQLTFTTDKNSSYSGDNSNTNDEVIKIYRKLLKKLHPDQGGNSKLFQEIKDDYDSFRNSI